MERLKAAHIWCRGRPEHFVGKISTLLTVGIIALAIILLIRLDAWSPLILADLSGRLLMLGFSIELVFAVRLVLIGLSCIAFVVSFIIVMVTIEAFVSYPLLLLLSKKTKMDASFMKRWDGQLPPELENGGGRHGD